MIGEEYKEKIDIVTKKDIFVPVPSASPMRRSEFLYKENVPSKLNTLGNVYLGAAVYLEYHDDFMKPGDIYLRCLHVALAHVPKGRDPEADHAQKPIFMYPYEGHNQGYVWQGEPIQKNNFELFIYKADNGPQGGWDVTQTELAEELKSIIKKWDVYKKRDWLKKDLDKITMEMAGKILEYADQEKDDFIRNVWEKTWERDKRAEARMRESASSGRKEAKLSDILETLDP